MASYHLASSARSCPVPLSPECSPTLCSCLSCRLIAEHMPEGLLEDEEVAAEDEGGEDD